MTAGNRVWIRFPIGALHLLHYCCFGVEWADSNPTPWDHPISVSTGPSRKDLRTTHPSHLPSGHFAGVYTPVLSLEAHRNLILPPTILIRSQADTFNWICWSGSGKWFKTSHLRLVSLPLSPLSWTALSELSQPRNHRRQNPAIRKYAKNWEVILKQTIVSFVWVSRCRNQSNRDASMKATPSICCYYTESSMWSICMLCCSLTYQQKGCTLSRSVHMRCIGRVSYLHFCIPSQLTLKGIRNR